MNPLSPPLEKLQIRDRELKAHIAQLGEMRPGSLVECYRNAAGPTATVPGQVTEDTGLFGW
jgi:hypothetical protein